jgi:hypothetical protein
MAKASDMSGLPKKRSKPRVRPWIIKGTVIEVQETSLLLTLNVFNTPQSLSRTSETPGWLCRIGVHFTAEIPGEDVRAGKFAGQFTMKPKQEVYMAASEATRLINHQLSRDQAIDLTTGGLDGHEVVRQILARVAPKISPSSLLGYCDTETEQRIKERIQQIWHLPAGEIVLTDSGTEALFLTMLASENGFFAQEPSYFGVWRAADKLKRCLQVWNHPDCLLNSDPNGFVYLCPNHHPATGDSLTMEMRKAVTNPNPARFAGSSGKCVPTLVKAEEFEDEKVLIPIAIHLAI